MADGGGAALVATPSSHSFGVSCLSALASPATVTITNIGNVAEPLSLALAQTVANQFSLDATTCTSALAPSASCTATVGFHPTSSGGRQATLVASTASGGTAMVVFDGAGASCAPMTLSPGTIGFGSVPAGDASASQTFTITNGAAITTGTLAVSSAGSDPTQFEITADTCNGLTLGPAATCRLDVRFKPTSLGPKSASMFIVGNPGGTLNAQVSGTATPHLAVSPANCDFGAVCAPQSKACDLTITNTGGDAEPVTLSLSGSNAAQFSIASTTCTQPLAPAGSCTATVLFHSNIPAGSKTASFTAAIPSGAAVSGALDATTLTCSGLSASPTALSFGTIALGAVSASQTLTVTNPAGSTTGALMVQLSGAALGDFELAADGCSGVALSPAASCTLDVRFRPTMTGLRAASLSVQGTPGGTVAVTLGGDGSP